MNDRYIPGVPCWVDTTQPDPEAAAAFYAAVFGWEVEDVTPPGSPDPYLIARLGGRDVAAIASLADGAPPAAAWNTYVWVDSADATADAVRAAGGTVLAEPADVGESGRMAVLADTEGAAFRAWEARAHRGAQAVNEPGTLNFNGLHTHDIDAARAFYGAVFGWTTLDLGEGHGWMLPGYGDFLETINPGTKAMQEEGGAPAGFVDVVATVAPAAPAEEPHWDVTFAVDDADVAAERAAAGGGEVLLAPFDAPWVRMTVLRDPAGATFVASKFVPENAHLAEA